MTAGQSPRDDRRVVVRLLARVMVAGLVLDSTALAAAGAGSRLAFSVATALPAGFEHLDEPQRAMVDLYYHDRRIGQALVMYRPGHLRFLDPLAVASVLPDLADRSAVEPSLTQELATNPQAVCTPLSEAKCIAPAPDPVAIVFDENRFRVDLYIKPSLLQVVGEGSQYLPAPAGHMSFVSALSGAFTGTVEEGGQFSLQNQSILGFGRGRIRARTIYSSSGRLEADVVTAEVDRERQRYIAGAFWTPGSELAQRRKILGLGFTTQFDTRRNREQAYGTPIVVYLARRARVAILRNGQLLTSRSYEAGNQLLDVSSLPDGSYEITLRIEDGGAPREERRFFVKNPGLPPVGEVATYVFAGLLGHQENGSLKPTDHPYAQASIARRFTNQVSLSGTVTAMDELASAEVGGTLIQGYGRLEAAVMLNSNAYYGIAARAHSPDGAPVSFSLSGRHLQGRAGPAGLVGSDAAAASASSITRVRDREWRAFKSYSQIGASLSVRMGMGQLGVLGDYVRSDGASSYSLGATAYLPIIERQGLQLLFRSDAICSNRGNSLLAGIQVQRLNFGRSFVADIGYRSASSRTGSESGRQGEFVRTVASWDGVSPQLGAVSVSGRAEHDVGTDSIGMSAGLRGSYGSAYAEASRTFSGSDITSYSLDVATGFALGDGGAAIGGSDPQESGIRVQLEGDALRSNYEVLVNDVVAGHVSAGRNPPFFLAPYATYRIRLRPTGSELADIDLSEREVTLYPGNVAVLR